MFLEYYLPDFECSFALRHLVQGPCMDPYHNRDITLLPTQLWVLISPHTLNLPSLHGSMSSEGQHLAAYPTLGAHFPADNEWRVPAGIYVPKLEVGCQCS